MNWQIKRFNELSPDELYQIMALRLEVFVVEQNCVYQDADGKDHEALHLFASENGSITAYCRIFGPGIYFEDSSIGRVIVKESFRGSGLGHELMKRAIKSEEHTSELQSRENLVCRLLLEKKNR